MWVSKRGFTSRRAAADARRRLTEQVKRRGVVHTTETFGAYWERWLVRRRPYLEQGTWSSAEDRAAGRPRAAARPCASPPSTAGFVARSPESAPPIEQPQTSQRSGGAVYTFPQKQATVQLIMASGHSWGVAAVKRSAELIFWWMRRSDGLICEVRG
jgi:hypothetical protein